ncbi:MAG: hypothetical protein IAE81_25075 [Caldilineaceae bacterium]|nr:hypothetical protein [Caldilineaceae bacterium]
MRQLIRCIAHAAPATRRPAAGDEATCARRSALRRAGAARPPVALILASAAAYGACDLVCADIDLGVPDSRIIEILDLCETISARHQPLLVE